MNHHNHKPRAPRADGLKTIRNAAGVVMRLSNEAALAHVSNGTGWQYCPKAQWKEQANAKVSS